MSTSRRRLSCAIVFVAALCLSIPAHSQQLATATITGELVDPVGKAISRTSVLLRNTAQGTVRTSSTGEQGTFSFPDIEAGVYELSIDANAGFAAYRRNLEVAVGQVLRLPIQLSIGASHAEVQVGSEPQTTVDTVTSVVGDVIGSRQIENLPLNGRNFLELALLVPGNSPAPNFDPTKQHTVLISSAGQVGRGGNVTIDGADNNDDAVGGSLGNVPQDAVQEFQIASNRFSAALGRSGSSVINVVTKQGSNLLHGGVAIYERDKVLQGLPATFDPSVGSTPPFHRQQYAGDLGGPVRQDKAWWFVAMEDRRQLGGDLIGTRNFATRTIDRTFVTAPLNDFLSTARFDWQLTERDRLGFRHSLELEDDIGASQLDRSIGSAAYRQRVNNHFQSLMADWVHIFNANLINRLRFSDNNFSNLTVPTSVAPQITFPSLDDGATFRVPQGTKQFRLQFDDTVSWNKGRHGISLGGELQRIDADFDLGVFLQGNIQAVEDFPDFDRNGDGKVDDNDLLFAVALRSSTPTRPLTLPNDDNNHVALFAQDDWKARTNLTLNLGLRWELDTNANNLSWYKNRNPIIQPFLKGERHRDYANFAPRIGFNYSPTVRTSIHGGYGIYYDRITLEVMSLEKGFDGRALALNVTAGNAIGGPNGPAYLNPDGTFVPGAPQLLSSPFSGFLLVGAGNTGIDIIDNRLRNPMVQQFNLGVEEELVKDFIFKLDGIHNLGTRFIIGRPVGSVINPGTGGPDAVTNLESSVNTKYDGLWASLHKRFSRGEAGASYTFAKAYNYANDDQIPFSYSPIDPNNLHREYGPPPNDQRHRVVIFGVANLPYAFHFSPIWTIASGVPMDILLPDASERVPTLQRNAGGREFHSAQALNAFITQTNANGGVTLAGGGTQQLLPLVDSNARFNHGFDSLDFRLSRDFHLGDRFVVEALGEVFNAFNTKNILGTSNLNYSGYQNVLVRDSSDPTAAGYLHSSAFGKQVSTAGGVFGSGGPRAFQFAGRLRF